MIWPHRRAGGDRFRLASQRVIHYPERLRPLIRSKLESFIGLLGILPAWQMLSWSAPSGGTKARARSSIGCPNRPTSSSASRAAIMPAIRFVINGDNLQALAAALRRGAARKAVGHRQWRGARSARAARRDRRAQEDKASRSRPENLRIAENTALILPLHRELDALRESAMRQRRYRHHAARHRSRLRG